MKTYNSVCQLAEKMGCGTLHEIGKCFYDDTDCGVGTTFVMFNGDWLGSWELSNSTVTRKLPNILTGGIKGIKFHATVEGSNAEFSADVIEFPCSQSQIDNAIQYLEDSVKSYLIENSD